MILENLRVSISWGGHSLTSPRGKVGDAVWQ